MANKKLQATAQLFLNTKDAQKDAQKFVDDLKQKLKDIESAADKMTVFKDMVGYIAQVDRALAALRKNNKEAFNSMFDGLDVNLKQQLEGLFGVNGAQLGQVDALREKLNTLTLKSSIKEIRTFAKEINTLFTSIGVSAPFDNIDEQFSGRTNTSHIQALATALANFATVWEDLSANIAKGFGTGSGGGISGALASQNEEIKEEVGKLKKQKEEYQELIDIFNGKNVKVKTTKKTDVAQLQDLIDKFNEAQAAVQQFENANNTSGDAYKKAVAEAFKTATLLKNTMDYVAEHGSDAGALFVSSNVGKNDPYGLAETYLGKIKSSNLFQEIQSYVTQQVQAMDSQAVKPSNALEKTASVYDELKKKLQEYSELQDKISNDDSLSDSETNELYDKVDALEKYFTSLDKVGGKQEEIKTILGDLTFGDIDSESAFDSLCNLLGVEIPSAAEKAAEAIDDIIGSKSTTGDANKNIQLLKEQLQIVHDEGRKIGDHELGFAVDVDGAAYFIESCDNIVKASDEASVAVRALNENMTILGHTHPDGGGQFSAGDYISMINQRRSGVIAPSMVMGDKYASVLNLADATDDVLTQIENVLRKHGKSGDDTVGANVISEMQSIFAANGMPDALQVIRVAEGMDELAESLYRMGTAATSSQTPLQKLQSLIQYYSGGKLGTGNLSEFDDYWSEFESGAKSAAVVFDEVMSKLGATDLEGNAFDISSKQYQALGAALKLINTDASNTSVQVVDETNQKLREQEQLWENVKVAIKNGIGEAVGLDNTANTLEVIEREIKEGVLTSLEECIARFKEFSNISAEDSLTLIGERQRVIADYYGTYLPGEDEVVSKEEADKLRQLSVQQEQLYQNLRLAIKGTLSDVVDADDMTYAFDTIEKEIEEGLLITLDQCVEKFKLLTGLDDKRLTRIGDDQRVADDWDYYRGNRYVDDYETVVDSSEYNKLLDERVELLKQVSSLQAKVDGMPETYFTEGEFESSMQEYCAEVDRLQNELAELKVSYDVLRDVHQFATEDLVDYEREIADLNKIIEDLQTKLKSKIDMAGTGVGSSSTAGDNALTADSEIDQLEVLHAKLLEVKSAVDAKTVAFEEEHATVDAVVDAEVMYLQTLIEKLQEVVTQIKLVNNEFNLINTNAAQLETTPKSNTDTGSTRYVTDQQGNPATMYRGLHGSYSGLVSNRYHGGTFFTDNIELAREYAGELGKVEKVLLSMKNPLEIEGNGTTWNKIEYIGDNADEASQKLHKLKSEISDLNKLIEQYEKIGPTEYETKQIERGFISADHTQAQRQAYEYSIERAQKLAEIENIYADSNNPYGKKNTNEIVEIAKSAGYDGVIFKNIIDSATGDVQDISNVMVTFTQDQIHHIDTISTTFNEAINTFKNHFGELTQYINTTDDEVQESIREMFNLKWKVDSGEITNDEYEAFVTKDPIAKNYEQLARKAGAFDLTDIAFNDSNWINDIVAYINGFILNMRQRLEKIATTFGMEDIPLDQLANMNVDDETVSGNENIDVNKDYALDSTLLTTNGILNNILSALGNNESISQLVEPLNNAVIALKNVADGNFEYQKKQQTDTSVAMAKIADPVQYKNISDIAAGSVSDLGSEVQIKSLKALVDGAVKVEGAFKNAQDKWEGFTVRVNDSNQAVDLAVNKQSAFANALNETAAQANVTAQEVKQVQEAPVEDPFTKAIYNQRQEFNEYRASLQNVDYLTDNLRSELDGLGVSLQQVGSQPGLDAWAKSFDVLKSSVKEVQTEFAQMNNSKINLYQKELNSTFNKLTLPQKEELFEEYTKAIVLLNKQKQAVKDGHAVELAGIKQITSALQEKINAQIKANQAAKDAEKAQKANANFGSTAAINATAKYNSLTKIAGSNQFANSAVVASALEQYTQAYNKLIAKRDELMSKDVITDEDKADFKELTTECNNYASALDSVIKNTMKLKGNKANTDDYMLGDDFVDDAEGRKAALTDFVKQVYNIDVAAEDFKDNWNKVVFAVDNGDGTFTQMTATFTEARNEIVALAGDTKKVQSAFANFWDELKGKFKSIGAYLVASFSLHEVWSVVRQGVQYVREIDSALTELKKVTDETDASYAQFLQDMSKTGGVIGATVADLTTMASEWARLGYSMEEAGKLAESTAILLNVSEFDDATAASEALISTMQAFQYTADESGHVVDILNEVKVTCLLIQ